jgi:hypothetical protein
LNQLKAVLTEDSRRLTDAGVLRVSNIAVIIKSTIIPASFCGNKGESDSHKLVSNVVYSKIFDDCEAEMPFSNTPAPAPA